MKILKKATYYFLVVMGIIHVTVTPLFYHAWNEDALGSIVRMAQPLGLEYIDHKTEKAITSSEGWKRVFELGKQIYSNPAMNRRKIRIRTE